MTWKAEEDGKGEMYVDGELIKLPGKGNYFSKAIDATRPSAAYSVFPKSLQ